MAITTGQDRALAAIDHFQIQQQQKKKIYSSFAFNVFIVRIAT